MAHWRNKRENKKYLETNESKKYDDPEPMQCSKSSSKRKIYSNTILPQDTRKIPNNQSNLIPRQRQQEKQEQKIKLKVNRKKKLKIRGAPILGAYILIIAVSSSWIDPLIII